MLGFGCASILGAVGASVARRALDCALDCGINHFDLARSYGYGEAEAYVGRALRGNRERVVLVSKFGIQANWKAQLLRPLKPWVRRLRESRKPVAPVEVSAAGMVKTIGDRLHDRLPLRGVVMRRSLEKSLRALRTDYLDMLLVHEPKESLRYLEELSEMADTLKGEGKIRGWGLAFSWEDEALHRKSWATFDLLQFNNSPGARHYEQVQIERAEMPNIFFSPFRSSAGPMRPAEKLRKLYTDFPASVVLCSMFRDDHIRENAGLADRS